ncbi:MAG: nicotinamide-nucleotide amidohydrolase family protein [Candidatus Omnitrophica bacterium]|nr:nicotinamide-nucleotide amidohydrolase family protein [Candidatus Omnitrophota bacterium]
MRAEIISIGTELLLGHIVNTNAAYLARKLAETGIDLYHQMTVGDNPLRLYESLRRTLDRSDIVITTGGLGPTVDDITIRTVAKLLNRRLIPKGVKWLRNKVGTAPGLIAEHKGKIIICLPGPPRELEPMFANDALPYLRKKSGGWTLLSRAIKTTGLAESQVNAKVKDLLDIKPPTTVGIYAKLGEVTLKVMSKAKGKKAARRDIARVEKTVVSRLKNNIFGYDDQTLEEAVGKALRKKKRTIAVAESCTGGLVSSRITNVSGSSDYFLMGTVTYANKAKEKILGVPKEALKKRGAVSKEVAAMMAKGVRKLAGAYIGIGITGIAGPTGGTAKKPVGLVYIALVTDKKRIVRECRFRGSRKEIKFQASQVALDMIRRNA